MNVRELKDNDGKVFSPKVSTESVYLKGSTTNLESKLSSMDTTISGKANTSSLATVATSGSYYDLINKPNIVTIGGDGVVEVGHYMDFHTNGTDTDFTFRFTNGADGHLDCSGGLWATGFYVSSSRKVKENIEPTKVKGEDMINSVSVVDFNYIDDETHAPKVGFIAEDTDPLFSTKERKAMDSANCIGILMKAVQELSAKIKELESKIN